MAEENTIVKMGSHHTLDLELNRKFTLEKAEGWDAVALEQLSQAVDTRRRVSVWAVVMGEGTANIALVTEFQTILRQRVEVYLPGKRQPGPYEKALEKFFKTLLDTLLRHMELPTNAPLLLASPGFTASAFQKYIKAEAVRTGDKALRDLGPNIIIAHSSSPHLHSLAEVLKDKTVLAKLSDTKYARETALIDRFSELMRKDDGRAWYGHKEVTKAVEKGAVGRGGGVLLINNALFRSDDLAERKRWVALVEKVRDEEGGEVRVMSEAHESGKRLEGLGGIAAILTFPLEDLDEDEEEDTGNEPE